MLHVATHLRTNYNPFLDLVQLPLAYIMLITARILVAQSWKQQWFSFARMCSFEVLRKSKLMLRIS